MNTAAIKKAEQKFNVTISQDPNLSDQSETFKRFEVKQDFRTIGHIVLDHGIYITYPFKNYDGTYAPSDLIIPISNFLNEQTP